mmetsp:Transcript_18605/g.27304  ORF Transcript_18605/g.27304 Transcript_18605/m.27304 type:complete len:400 (+) Transcript_18605:187-1386(+)|eukprot:CAMPEP_0195520888 /NCGR_PEP_ID=MMETSP0794_2-20130614/17603_1 /TAXON_ID=515487 /ORGANISM="Stephanopyxis turris, Strain CCMP 815" /LENGTH=399 /DNA_ID=CAMNT_0040650325 /DNA_START=187 /DNA_END=1386 /DNA_ORIENTATION=-
MQTIKQLLWLYSSFLVTTYCCTLALSIQNVVLNPKSRNRRTVPSQPLSVRGGCGDHSNKNVDAWSLNTKEKNDTFSSQSQPSRSNWRTYEKNTFVREDHPVWSQSHFEESFDLYERLQQCDDEYVAPQIKEALECLEGAYRLYGSRCLVGSYNGGKDAVAILHLMRAAHAKHCHDLLTAENSNKASSNANRENKSDYHDSHYNRPRVIYFEHVDEFPEVTALLESTVHQYDLDMLAFGSYYSFSDGLSILVQTAQPKPLAFVLGTRKSDPNAKNQGLFAPSSSYMPPFMRVNPILNWSYGQVWHFLRKFELPYCSLYDQGYTSLGNVKDTLPCPALKKKEGEGLGGYWPAYMLEDWDQERAGRVKKKKKVVALVANEDHQTDQKVIDSSCHLSKEQNNA